MQLIDVCALPAMPWKNGGGVTRNIIAAPPDAGFDDFDWRVSIADVASSGPFSRFPGVDRTILLLEGAGMNLRMHSGAILPLTTPWQPLTFSGDDNIESHLLNGPSRDFNVMTRRTRAQARVDVWHSREHPEPGFNSALFFCARGLWQFRTENPGTLPARWALSIKSPAPQIQFEPRTPDAVMIAVQIHQRERTGEDS